MERGVVPGELEVDLSSAMNGSGVFVFQIYGEPAVDGDLAGGWLLPALGGDVQVQGLRCGEEFGVSWDQVGYGGVVLGRVGGEELLEFE